jgi:branched-chain amino acid transport system permease protein
METFVQVLLSGVLVGGLYGLLSAGLSLSFGITRVVNFAHGEFVTVGMYAGVLLSVLLGALMLPVLVVAAAVAGLLGAGIYRMLISRTSHGTVREEEAHMPQIVLTIGLSVVLQGALLAGFSAKSRSASGVLAGNLQVVGVIIPVAQLVAFGVAIVVFAILQVLVGRTDFGRALRAIVDDRDAASAVGIDHRRMFAWSFGIGTALACLAGGLLATYLPVTPLSGSGYLAIAFATVVLGGLGSITGAFLGGLLVGVIQLASATYLAVDLQNVVVWIAFIVILLVRPSGLLGRRVVA